MEGGVRHRLEGASLEKRSLAQASDPLAGLQLQLMDPIGGVAEGIKESDWHSVAGERHERIRIRGIRHSQVSSEPGNVRNV